MRLTHSVKQSDRLNVHFKSFFAVQDKFFVTMPQKHVAASRPKSPNDAKSLGVKLCSSVFTTGRGCFFLTLSLLRPHGLGTRVMGGDRSKAPLSDLQAMSIKLECHVLSVMHSHAVLTPRRSLVNLSPAGQRFQTSVFL